jgi:hypothetical protein
MRFTATLVQSGKTATGIEVPEAIVSDLGGGKRPAVTVSFRGYSYRSSIAPMAGSWWIPVSAEHRAGAGVAAGETLDVDVELDTAPREVEVPGDLADALAAAPGAREAFDALSYSNQRRQVLSVTEAKTDATRQKRVAKVIEALAPTT